MAKIHTVLGEIEPSALGPTLSHEHAMIGWMGHHLDPASVPDLEKVAARVGGQLSDLRKAHGVTGFVDLTPLDIGRNIEFEAEVSRRSGVHIIGATGLYVEGAGIPRYFQQRDIDEIEDLFFTEVAVGVGTTGIRCGVIKVATAGSTISPNEEKVLRAAARVSKRTGVAISSHTDPGGWAVTNVGAKQLDIIESEGADLSRVAIGHACGTPNIQYLMDVLKRGGFISYDRVGSIAIVPDEVRAAMVAGLVSAGYAGRVMLSHDGVGWVQQRPRPPGPRPPDAPSARPSATRARALSDFAYIHRTFLPLLRQGGVSEANIERILVEAPSNAFAF